MKVTTHKDFRDVKVYEYYLFNVVFIVIQYRMGDWCSFDCELGLMWKNFKKRLSFGFKFVVRV